MNDSTASAAAPSAPKKGRVKQSSVLDRALVLEMVRVTEAAAIAASKLIGRGDEKAADAAAVEAMRRAFDELEIDGTVVIGEGERDEAPMLYIGEKVGGAPGRGPKIDIALDPLEGTTITAKAGPNSLAVLAAAEEGCLLNAPDTYMDKIAVGPGYPEGVISLAKSPTENVKAVAAAKGVAPADIVVCVLDRPRHAEMIAELRGLGCGIYLIPDGDVAGVIAVTDEDTAKAVRLRACWRQQRCGVSAGNSAVAWCFAMKMKKSGPANGASPTSTGSTSWKIWPRVTASLPRRGLPAAPCSMA